MAYGLLCEVQDSCNRVIFMPFSRIDLGCNAMHSRSKPATRGPLTSTHITNSQQQKRNTQKKMTPQQCPQQLPKAMCPCANQVTVWYSPSQAPGPQCLENCSDVRQPQVINHKHTCCSEHARHKNHTYMDKACNTAIGIQLR